MKSTLSRLSRRKFLRLAGGGVAWSLIPGCSKQPAPPPEVKVLPPVQEPPVAFPARTNWAGNVQFDGELVRPNSVEELRQIVRRVAKVRPLGTGHSFSPVAKPAAGGTQISLARFTDVTVNDDG